MAVLIDLSSSRVLINLLNLQNNSVKCVLSSPPFYRWFNWATGRLITSPRSHAGKWHSWHPNPVSPGSDCTPMWCLVSLPTAESTWPSSPDPRACWFWMCFLSHIFNSSMNMDMVLSLKWSCLWLLSLLGLLAPCPGLFSLLQLHKTLTFTMNSLHLSCLCLLAGSCQQEFSYKMCLDAKDCPHGLQAISWPLSLLFCSFLRQNSAPVFVP